MYHKVKVLGVLPSFQKQIFNNKALEVSLLWKANNLISEIILVSIGDESSKLALKAGLALGADRAVLYQTDNCIENIDSAKLICDIIKEESTSIVFLEDPIAKIVAKMLNWPELKAASNIELDSLKALLIAQENLNYIITCAASIDSDRINSDSINSEWGCITINNIIQAQSKIIEIKNLPKAMDLKSHVIFLDKKSITKRLNQPIQTASEVIDYLDSKSDSKLNSSENIRPELQSAKMVLGIGRGIKNKAQFKKVERIASKLNAAIGGTHAAVEAGFITEDLQIGQSGKIIEPDIYIAFGISGAIQHIVGIKKAKIIIAINHDPNAAIFQMADYKWVADLEWVLSELEQIL